MIRGLILASALLLAQPEIIMIEMVDPEPVKAEKYVCSEVTEYDWAEDDLKAVAQVLWAETGKGQSGKISKEKECICYLILNRTRYGDPFPSTIKEVCKQKGEFNRGHYSDKNVAIARAALNAYQSQLDGNIQNILFPQTAIYMSRIQGTLCFYDANWHKVFEAK